MITTGITTTGDPDVDTATAEIAVLVRDARIGSHVRYSEQDHYDEAMRLRDVILGAGQPGTVKVRVAVGGHGAWVASEEWPPGAVREPGIYEGTLKRVPR